MRRIALLIAVAASLLLAACASRPSSGPGRWVGRDEIPLIKREALFKTPELSGLRMSPDGSKMIFTKSDPNATDPADRLPNIWIAPMGDFAAAKRLTNDTNRGVRRGSWAWNGRHVLYGKDTDGNEKYHVVAVDTETGVENSLTPQVGDAVDGKLTAGVAAASRDHPNEIIIALNDTPGFRFQNLYRVNLLTGESKLHFRNPGYLGFEMDDDYNVRFVMTIEILGPEEIQFKVMARTDDGKLVDFMTISADDIYTTGLIGFSKDRKYAYATRSEGRDTAALYVVDTATGESRRLYADEQADVGGVALDPDDRTPQYAVVDYLKPRYKVFNPALYDEFRAIERVHPGSFDIVSSTADNRKWLVVFSTEYSSIPYYLWDRDTQTATFLTRILPHLDELPLAPMHGVVIKARDGLMLPSYITVPHEAAVSATSHKTSRRVPLILNVHGGPNARDSHGLHPEHQIFANRGYAVLSVNYRGSTGFGKNHVNQSIGEWGRKMHDDLLDAVEWAIDEGIADPERIAIYGGSYGGYAALWGMTNTPEKFRCGVSVVGPSNLETLLLNAPETWGPIMPMMYRSLGNPHTPEGQKKLAERSPINYVENIQRPLLVGQGANDPRVRREESDRIVAAMKERNIPVTYVLFPDEGHGFSRPENNQAFYAITEAFLAEHLGGRAQPFEDIITKSSAQLVEGADQVKGLPMAAGLVKPEPEPAPVVETKPEPEPAAKEPEPVVEAKPEPPKKREMPKIGPDGKPIRRWDHGAAGE